jgi:rubrerythrin
LRAEKAQRLVPSAEAGPPAALDDHLMHRDLDPEERRGAEVKTEQRCAVCGYGVVIAGIPPRCPICGSTRWISGRAAMRPY